MTEQNGHPEVTTITSQKKRRKLNYPLNENTQLNTLLNSIEAIEFDLRRTRNGLLDIKLHLVASPRALVILSGSIGVLIVVIKLLGR